MGSRQLDECGGKRTGEVIGETEVITPKQSAPSGCRSSSDRAAFKAASSRTGCTEIKGRCEEDEFCTEIKGSCEKEGYTLSTMPR